MKTSIRTHFCIPDFEQEFKVYLESAQELDSNFLASLREHFGKSLSIYARAIANGVDKKDAKKLLPILLAESMVG
jgi:hypothetical protein